MGLVDGTVVNCSSEFIFATFCKLRHDGDYVKSDLILYYYNEYYVVGCSVVLPAENVH